MLYGLCGVCNVHAWRGDVSSVICGFVCGMGKCSVCGMHMWHAVYRCVAFVDSVYVVCHSAWLIDSTVYM